jgi:mannose-6-phosphate isomerase-like protein (cupin superfamily)
MTTDKFTFSMTGALATLPGPDPEDRTYNTLFTHGSAEALVYAPRGSDNQEIHDKDEFYVVIKGGGKFFNGGKTQSFGPGDIIFVAAGVEHRFVDFSNDLAVWVLLYGPIGGEKPYSAKTNS